jgi:hypothetical protein
MDHLMAIVKDLIMFDTPNMDIPILPDDREPREAP